MNESLFEVFCEKRRNNSKKYEITARLNDEIRLKSVVPSSVSKMNGLPNLRLMTLRVTGRHFLGSLSDYYCMTKNKENVEAAHKIKVSSHSRYPKTTKPITTPVCQ
jgi:hypothetical protein